MSQKANSNILSKGNDLRDQLSRNEGDGTG